MPAKMMERPGSQFVMLFVLRLASPSCFILLFCPAGQNS